MAIDPILNLQDDQMVNQFKLVFPKGIPGSGNASLVELRMDKTIDMPEETSSTYEFFIRGMKIVKTGMLDETEKTLTFDVRLDQQWGVYDSLITWKRMCHDGQQGTRMPSSVTGTVVLIQALDGQNAVVKTFKLGFVFCKGVKVAAFDNESADPARVTLNLVWNTRTDS